MKKPKNPRAASLFCLEEAAQAKGATLLAAVHAARKKANSKGSWYAMSDGDLYDALSAYRPVRKAADRED